LWMRWWNFLSHKIWVISSSAEWALGFWTRELCSMRSIPVGWQKSK
jgi:hypothetical protein